MRNAFTLIELLIVVAIIGILAAIAVPNFLNAQIRAKIAKTESEMSAYGTAAEMYRLDNNDYHPHNHTSWQNKISPLPSHISQRRRATSSKTSATAMPGT